MDSFITSPSWPVIIILPLPGISLLSINKISPPALVHASPVTTPGSGEESFRSWWSCFFPRYFSRFVLVTVSVVPSFLTSWTAAVRQRVLISFFRSRTPDSIVYSSIILRIAPSVTFNAFFLIPMASRAFGRRCLRAIWYFSTAV